MDIEKQLDEIIFNAAYSSQFTDEVRKKIAQDSFNLAIMLASNLVKNNSHLKTNDLQSYEISKLKITL